MEDSTENTAPKPYNDEEKLNSHLQQQKLRLGFHPSASVDPDPKHDPMPLPSDDLDRQTTNEEIANQEHQVLQLISEDIQNQLTTLLLEETGKASNKVVNRVGDDEGFSDQQTLSAELQYQQAVEEEIQNLVFEEKRKENDDDKGEGSNRYRNKNIYDDYDNYGSSEIEKEGYGSGVVEGDTGRVSGWRDGGYRNRQFPVRPDAEDCPFYMRTGACKFESNCKFNHPFRRKNQAAREKVKQNEESPERMGWVECKYHQSSGGCKYGKACRYKHSMRITPVTPIVEFNFLGLPIRPGEKECEFYMRNGSCKYGANCRFNHPDPTAMGGGDTLPGYSNGGSVPFQGASQSTMSPWSSPRALNEKGPFVPVVFPPPHGVPSAYPETNGYQWLGKDHVYPVPPERRQLTPPPAFPLNTPAENNFYTPHKHPPLIDEFPERPGQPECSYFMKTGDCKYKSGCKFHHPKNRFPMTAAPFALTLSDNGLPQRPDQNICSYYNRYGICKFGPSCKFDHPVNYAHSAAASPGFVAPANSASFGNSATVDDGWE